MSSRKDLDAGVRELARLENWDGESFQVRNGERSWDSTRATLRVEVALEAPA